MSSTRAWRTPRGRFMARTFSRRRASCSEAPRTVRTKDRVVVCPAASIAVHVIVLGPTGSCAPDAGPQVSEVGRTSSVATAMYETKAPCELVEFVEVAAGKVIAGGVTSVTAL